MFGIDRIKRVGQFSRTLIITIYFSIIRVMRKSLQKIKLFSFSYINDENRRKERQGRIFYDVHYFFFKIKLFSY